MKQMVSSIKAIGMLLCLLMMINCADKEVYNESFFEKHYDLFGTNKKEVSLLKSSSYYKYQSPVVRYLSCNDAQESVWYEKQISLLCNYTKLPYGTILPGQLKHIERTTQVILINSTKELSEKELNQLLSFVNTGGTLVLLSGNQKDTRLNYFIGLQSNSKSLATTATSGIYCNTSFLPNSIGEAFLQTHVHEGFSANSFNKYVKPILVAASDQSYPVITKNEIGKGQVVFYNTTLPQTKTTRGLLYPSLLLGIEGIPYPINNISTIFLDDFPAPTYDIIKEPIKTEFNNTSVKDFVHDIWWPDMKKLAKELNIKYTTTLTFSYNDRVEPPFSFEEWEYFKGENNLSITDHLTYDILHAKHELGFHGYNHTSLTQKNWKEESIENSLYTVKKNWILKEFGALPITYIPPTNYIDKTGLKALKAELPSIKYICSNYLGVYRKGGNREFDIDRYENKLYNYPRVTSGFVLDQAAKLDKESVYLFTGIWTHFMHPDDIFQIPTKENISTRGAFEYRNAKALYWNDYKGKKGFLSLFKQTLKKHQQTFPFNEYITAKSGAKRSNIWRNANFRHQLNSNNYHIKREKSELTQNQQHWFVYIKQSNLSVIKEHLAQQGIVYTSTALLEGELLNIKTNIPEIQLPLCTPHTERIANIDAVYQTFRNNKRPIKSEIVNEKLLSLTTITSQLKDSIMSKALIDSTQWNRYATYKHWQEQPLEVWQDLENHYQQFKHPSSIAYSTILAKTTWYSSEKEYQKWLLRRLENTATTADLEEYIENNSEDNSTKVIATLEEIIQRKPTQYSREMYINRLLHSNSSLAHSKIQKLTPSEAYKEVAHDIAWYFYHKNDLNTAIKWGQVSDQLAIEVLLDWLYQTGQIELLETTYITYIKNSPSNNTAKLAMAHIYLALGEFKKACVIALQLDFDSVEAIQLKKSMMSHLSTLKAKKQIQLIRNHPKIFPEKLADSLIEQYRWANNNRLSFSGTIASDRNNMSFFDKLTTYEIKAKNKFTHLLSATNTNVFSLKNTITEADNIDRDLVGIAYQIKSPQRYKKINYWVGGRVERDIRNDDLYYYRANIGVNYNKNQWFISSELSSQSVRNGPSYSKNIYRNRLNLYTEYSLKKTNIKTSLYTEGNYFTDQEYSSNSTVRLSIPIWNYRQFRLSPFGESQMSFASLNRANSYPYWIIDERVFGGGGLHLTLGKPYSSKTYIWAETAYFLDTYTQQFYRFSGRASVVLFNYFQLQLGGEYYLQSEFYSNQFWLGIHYTLK